MLDDLPDLPLPGAGASPEAAPAESFGGAIAVTDAAAEVITLSLGDLLPDANGEIVVESLGDHPHLSIVTDERICDAGVVDAHQTADGVDVAGFGYFAFESGTRLYYGHDVDLTITPSHLAG